MRKEIEKLLASDRTAYEIAQATGMSPSNITDLRVGKRKIDNITLANAEKLHDYQVNGNMRTAEDKAIENLKIKCLKKAVGDFNDWQGHAVIFYDKEERRAWTEVYASSNSWSEYHDDAVVSLHQKDDFLGRDNKTSMREIKRLILAL
jgi:hypothetical protein